MFKSLLIIMYLNTAGELNYVAGMMEKCPDIPVIEEITKDFIRQTPGVSGARAVCFPSTASPPV